MKEWENLPSEEEREKAYGFVYRLTLPDGRWYIGKKSFWSETKKKMACRRKGKVVEVGKKKTVRVRKESDWKTYMSSGWEIARYIEEHGPEEIRREILALSPAKGQLAYLELCYQIKADCLRDPKSLNGIVNVRLGRNIFPQPAPL